MTLAAIAEILAERAGRQFEVPFIEEMKDLVVIHRARILTNSLQKNPAHKKYYSNSIIVPLQDVSKDECAELASCSCENIKRTVNTVPRSLKVGTNPYDFVGSPGGAVPFGWTTFAAESFFSHNKYTKAKPRHTTLNDYIYIFNDKNIEKIRVEDVFADPRKLANFSCSAIEDIPCYSETNDFIADEAVAQLVIQSILTIELRLQPIQENIEIKADKNV